jgi:hypothetical protein
LNTVDQVMDDSTSTRPATTDAPTSTTSAETTPDPHIADDGGIYVPESTTSPQVVHDSKDAVAPHSTTVAPTTTEETTDIPTTVASKTTEQAVMDPTPATNQVFVPSWTEHTCIAADPQEKNKSHRRLGSSWHSSFSTQYECCVNNFIYSLELFESCFGFDLELLEPNGSKGKEYYPIWKEGKCQVVEGTEDGWLQTTFREKKYLCCFEYFKWQFDECLIR